MDKSTLAYLAARMKEASSWGGAAAFVLAALHLSANPDVVNAALSVIAATGSLIAILVPEGAASQPKGSN